MKSSKSEIFFLILSIILIAVLGGTYFMFGNQFSSGTSQTNQKVTTSSSATDDIQKAEAMVANLEANPNPQAIPSVQEAIDKVTDEDVKISLQARLNAVATELAYQENAEAAVTDAEQEHTSENVTKAQAAVDNVTDETKKSEFQARLDAVSQAIAAAGEQTQTNSNNDSAGNENYVEYYYYD